MTREQKIIYAAGLFDGEGTCGVYAEGAKHCAIRMHMVMTTPQGPSLFAELFGGHVALHSYRRPRADGGHYQPTYGWLVTAERAANALRELLPWLREKKAQAELCIEAREIQTRRRAAGTGHGNPYPPEDLARIVEIRDRVKALKRA